MNNTFKTSIAAVTLISAIGSVGMLGGWNSLSETRATHAVNESANKLETRSKTYDVDPTHSGVSFKIRHRGVTNFYGQFGSMQGVIEFDKLHMERSSMELSVPIKSILTGDRTRDGHIKGADFMNMRQYPEATFVSTGIEEQSDGVYTVTGEFTLSGKTETIVVRLAEVSSGVVNGVKLMGFEANFSIQRSDFGITKHLDPKDPEGGGLGDRVDLTVFVEAVGQ